MGGRVYLVTGGGGFIGSHVVRALVREGKRVRILDNSSSGSRARISELLGDVEWIDGDVRDMDVVRRACVGVEIVLHHAAIASVPYCIRDPIATHTVNVVGTLNVLTAARDACARRLIFASSSAVYGDAIEGPLRERASLRPQSPYAVQKLAAESYVRIWPALYGLETICLRYFNVFGPDQDPRSEYSAVVPRFIDAVLAGRPPVIYGDGEQLRDFVYVHDVVQVNLLAATAANVSDAVLNVGTGKGTTLNQLINMLATNLGRTVIPMYVPARAGDIRASISDISLLRTSLGYTPTVSLSAGLALMIGDILGGHETGEGPDG